MTMSVGALSSTISPAPRYMESVPLIMTMTIVAMMQIFARPTPLRFMR